MPMSVCALARVGVRGQPPVPLLPTCLPLECRSPSPTVRRSVRHAERSFERTAVMVFGIKRKSVRASRTAMYSVTLCAFYPHASWMADRAGAAVDAQPLHRLVNRRHADDTDGPGCVGLSNADIGASFHLADSGYNAHLAAAWGSNPRFEAYGPIDVFFSNAGIANDKIILVGFDACCGEIEAIKSGAEDASVAQFPAKMGELGGGGGRRTGAQAR